MQILDALDRPKIKTLRERDEFFWLDLEGPTDDDVRDMGKLFGFHHLAVEDTLEFDQRPKLDSYDEFVLLVYYGVHDVETAVEVHLFITGSFVVTVRREPCAHLVDVRRWLDDNAPKHSETFVVYKILDSLTDSFFPVLESMDGEIDELEQDMLKGATDEQRSRIFGLRRSLVEMRRVVTPQRDLFQSAGEFINEVPGLEAEASHDLFRDIYDHLIRISDLIDSYRDLLSGALDVHLSVQSNRMNHVMERLTIIATIFLPLTFLTGFFGQNFGWMVDHIKSPLAFFTLGLGGCLAGAAALWWFFRRAGYVH